MKLLFDHDEEVAWWVAERLDFPEFGKLTAIGVTGSTGNLVAGVVYHDYHEKHATIQLSLAADNPMWARFVGNLLHYPFQQLGVYKAWAVVDSANDLALRTDKHIGFTQEAILAHQFGYKRHGVVLRMLRPDYNRLYGDDYGQRRGLVSANAA